MEAALLAGATVSSGIKAINSHTSARFNRASFAQLGGSDKDRVLKELEAGSITLDGGVNARVFFAMLRQNTKEGYFSDPIYGGNKDVAAWKMIGFPGAHYDYSEGWSGMGSACPIRHWHSRAVPAGGRPEHCYHSEACRCGHGRVRL
jgi:Gluconate 2-dehydrogenase subunit 3